MNKYTCNVLYHFYSGIVVYFEYQYLDEKFTTVTNVFENEKHDSKYIYIDPEKQDLKKGKWNKKMWNRRNGRQLIHV